VYFSQPKYDLRTERYRILGVDLTEVPGIGTLLVQTLLTKIGPDLSKFRSAAAFASWLGLCPDNRVSGGKILSVRTRHVQNRAALALIPCITTADKFPVFPCSQLSWQLRLHWFVFIRLESATASLPLLPPRANLDSPGSDAM